MNLDISMPYDKQYLSVLRQLLTRSLEILPLSELVSNQVVLAVDEICSNLIAHVAAAPFERIYIHVKAEGLLLRMEIVDTSSKTLFDFKNYVPPHLQTLIRSRRKGGLGLRLVSSIMDKVEVFERDGYCVWRLEKHLATEKAS